MARRDEKLYRDETDKMVGGVCNGLGQYFDIDTNLVRVAFVVLAALGGGGILGYVILWAILDPKPVAAPPLAPNPASTTPDIVLDDPISLPDRPATPTATSTPQGQAETSTKTPRS